MKELEKINTDKIEVKANAEYQKQQKFIGSVRKHNGHKVWKINEKTLEVSEAEYSNKNYVVGGANKGKIIIEKDFAYVSCLNKKNALMKFLKSRLKNKSINK